MSQHSRLLFPGARWRGKAPVPVLHALGWKCVGVWSITMVATHLPQKACDAHVISFTRPSFLLNFPASKIVSAKESEREGLGTISRLCGACIAVKWLVSLVTHGSRVQLRAYENCLYLLLTSPPSCKWVPVISWDANHGSVSLISSGPGGTSGAHTTCCGKATAWSSCKLLARPQELPCTGSYCLVSRHRPLPFRGIVW